MSRDTAVSTHPGAADAGGRGKGHLAGAGAHPAGSGTRRSGAGGSRAGIAGLTATGLSVAATLAVALAGPSLMEPVLPGRPGQPPWSLDLHLSPYLAVSLTAVALAAGTAGLGLCLHAARRGWSVPPRAVLAAGLLAAVAITLLPPFGSADQLSYAAYGRMAVTGHDPYLTTPAMLPGDPVARAVQDWRSSPSVYGSLATGIQALASRAGGDSARLTVFMLSVAGLAAFAATGVLLHVLTRGSRERQLRAGLLWTLNPLLLQVLVAGAHVDTQAIAFGVAAIAIFCLGVPRAFAVGLGRRERPSGGMDRASPLAVAGMAAAAGAVAGLAFAVKLAFALVACGLVAAAALAWWPRSARWPRSAQWRPLALTAGGLTAGFLVTAAAAFLPWGLGSVDPALRAGSYVSIGSPWRSVRWGLRQLIGEASAGAVVRAGAILLALLLLALFARPLLALAGRAGPAGGPPEDTAGPVVPDSPASAAGLTALAAASCFAFGFAWLVAWPYVLPWYDGVAWALLALLPGTAPWAALDWLVLARTAALAFGYLPARGIALPAGLGWLQSVVRTGVTPVILLAVTVALVLVLRQSRQTRWPAAGVRLRPGPADGGAAPGHGGAARGHGGAAPGHGRAAAGDGRPAQAASG